eukprot:COSAG06_NODE_487_length_15107_cov_19.006330_6_plen_222_part_00
MGFEIRLSDRTWWYPEEKLQRLLTFESRVSQSEPARKTAHCSHQPRCLDVPAGRCCRGSRQGALKRPSAHAKPRQQAKYFPPQKLQLAPACCAPWRSHELERAASALLVGGWAAVSSRHDHPQRPFLSPQPPVRDGWEERYIVQRKVNAEGLRAEVAKAAAVRRRKPTGSVERRHYSRRRGWPAWRATPSRVASVRRGSYSPGHATHPSSPAARSVSQRAT